MPEKLNESTIAVIGIDIGKNSFHVVGLDDRGAIILRQKWSRSQVQVRFANIPPCLIGMEACVGAHHLSRQLQALGHNARYRIGTGDAFSQRPRLRRLAGTCSSTNLHGRSQRPWQISKRGNRYLRVLFVQAAWVVLIKPTTWKRHGLSSWIEAAKKRLHRNVLAIALANKLARIAWSVLARGRAFEAQSAPAAP